MAGELLSPPPPLLIAIAGFSGTGKSTVAAGVAPRIGAAPGAIVLRSDTIRKRLRGVPEQERLDSGSYTPEVSRRVYGTLTDRAGAIVRAGHAVVADAVFAGESERAAIERAAAAARVPFIGIWLEAPEPLLRARTSSRVADASDATPDVVRMQHAKGAGRLEWHRIDASAAPGRGARPGSGACRCSQPQTDTTAGSSLHGLATRTPAVAGVVDCRRDGISSGRTIRGRIRPAPSER